MFHISNTQLKKRTAHTHQINYTRTHTHTHTQNNKTAHTRTHTINADMHIHT